MKKILNNEKDYLEYAKERISSAREYLYSKETDFSDMSNVLVIQGYPYIERINLNISVDLENKKIHYFANDIEYLEERFDSIEEMLCFRLDDPLLNFLYLEELFLNRPSDDLLWYLQRYGYTVFKPKKDIKDNEIYIKNYEEKCHGSIPYGSVILGYSPDYMACLKKPFDRDFMDDGDVLLIHGDGKIYTFQFVNDELIFIDNFFKETEYISCITYSDESCDFEELFI